MSDNYGGFTMPRSDFFTLSSMYSDKLLTDFLPVVKNRAYQRYMQIQKNLLSSNEICGSLKMTSKYKYYFKESIELNLYFNFPVGSIYADITDQNFYLDIGDKMKFIRKFGNFNRPISSAEIAANPDIFTRVIRCTIGDYAFDKFYIMQDKYHRVYIGIKNSTTDGLRSNVITKLISEGTEENPTAFCLWKDLPSVAYQYNGPIGSVTFSSNTPGMKKLNISKSDAITQVMKKNDNNWMIYMTYYGSQFGQYLYTSTNVSLTHESPTTLSFDVPVDFLNPIELRNAVVSCIVVQRPNRKSIFAYSPSDAAEPWLALGDINRPVSIANVKIYEYDNTTCSYKRRIPIEVNNFNQEFNTSVSDTTYNENDFFSNIIFPSIYRFTSIKNPIRIELIEFDGHTSNTSFDNHLKSLFTYGGASDDDYSPDNYLEYLTWLNLNSSHVTYGGKITEVLNILTGYNPVNIYMDYKDYIASGKSLREYKFGKLMQLIASDPYIYSEYIKFMDAQNFNIIRDSGSPKHFKLNTGITTNSDLTSSSSLVMDDRFTCVNKNDEVVFFTEPHTYIKVHSDNPDASCMVFVGGRMLAPTRIKSRLNDIYIFIAQSKIKTYIEEAVRKFDTDFKDVFTVDNLITVEVYNKVNRSTSNQIHSTVVFDSANAVKKLFGGSESFKFKLSDLVVYNKTTGEYIPLSKFDITAILHKATIEFDDGTTDKVIGPVKDIIYMGTNAGEFYMTKDKVRIILDDETEDDKFPIDDTIDGGRKDNYANYQNKEWLASDLKFSINDNKLIGTEIEFVYSPVEYKFDIPLDKFTKDQVTGNYTYQLGGLITRDDIKLYELYINGEYLNPDKYITLPKGVGVDERLTIMIPETIPMWFESNDKLIQLRYNPSTYNCQGGKRKTIISTYSPQFENADLNQHHSVYKMPLYECENSNNYLNSDNSKAFIYKENTTDNSTGLAVPYAWMKTQQKIDLQDMLNVSILHPVCRYTPIFKDLNRDLSFITNSRAQNSCSVIDSISIDYNG